jgi:hypothetical protein
LTDLRGMFLILLTFALGIVRVPKSETRVILSSSNLVTRPIISEPPISVTI